MTNREVGDLIQWGAREGGARTAIARGISKADIRRMKQSGLKKKDIKAMRDYYNDFQELMNETARKGAENTPGARAELMELILKEWGWF